MAAQKYQIIVKGLRQAELAAHFEEAEIVSLSSEQFLLRGVVSDEPALYGLLERIRAVGLELVSVKCIESNRLESYER